MKFVKNTYKQSGNWNLYLENECWRYWGIKFLGFKYWNHRTFGDQSRRIHLEIGLFFLSIVAWVEIERRGK